MAFSACVRARLVSGASAAALLAAASPALAHENAETVSVSQPAAQEGPPVREVITVTAQRREQTIQDVPIAVTALSAEDLVGMRIEGGSELLRAVPNVAFSKANFSMYNFSIRGVGTKAISASSDPAVAISFNNTPLIRNRLFEQEYLDVNRVEVLRGPQGTLYGRNATGGVVNMFPMLPTNEFEGELGLEAGNYNTRRLMGMINVPITDTFAVRAAAASTQRDGFDYNSFNDTWVNDRDLWSARLSAQWEPNDRFSANIIWEHFEEDDRRARTGKQLCTRDPGPEMVGETVVSESIIRDRLSQGCLPGSLYDDAAYGVPNAASFPHMLIGGLTANIGRNPPGTSPTFVQVWDLWQDPYEGLTQSRNLREISTSYDPLFRAQNDIVQFNMEFAVTDRMTLYSQTAYAEDSYYSTQDYNRFVSNPIFNDSSQLVPAQWATPGGVYTDPQLGPSDRMLSADLSQSDNRQWYQEFRLASEFDGGFNFSVGANWLNFKSEDNYYVFNNAFTAIAELYYNAATGQFDADWIGAGAGQPFPEVGDIILCDDPNLNPSKECVYVDPTPLSDLAGDGHNYFRSKNVVEIRSRSIFGEGYWDLAPDLRLTAGLRYTEDEKITTPYPSQLLLGAQADGQPGMSSGGFVSRGYPALPDIEQSWGATTGRLVLDWAPDLGFTNDTLIYASFARGYKGGGTNPPRVDLNPGVIEYLPLAEDFEPEYLNAFEIGTKNTLMDGRLDLNVTGFFYDYTDYQVSQIVDRISLNENFDARMWGLELETLFQPTRNLQLFANIGYLNTRIADGEGSIDVMDRTQGDPDWTVLRPWVQVPSNCIAPTEHVETVLNSGFSGEVLFWGLQALCAGSARSGSFNPDFDTNIPLWALYGFTYDPMTEAPNDGRGIMADLGGNSLPNAPEWTVSVGGAYTFFMDDWELTLRGDYYWQDESYARVYNTEFDRIRSWDNANVSVTLARPRDGLSLDFFVKNVFDSTPITDFFVNSDDTGLTTNVFTLDPRLFALRVTKRF
ncbi:TonB-dependent receptor [Glycocaulis profundi]|nr:TonB-dependent receptor [Glycocaulis profundi]